MFPCLFALLLLGADPEPGTAKLKPIAVAPWSNSMMFPDTGKTQLLVLRSAAELVAATPYSNLDALPAVVEKMATAELAKALKVKQIDWNKQMVLVINHEKVNSGGHRIEVPSLKTRGKELVVSWKLVKPDGFATAVITRPGLTLLVAKHTGPVTFDPPAKKK